MKTSANVKTASPTPVAVAKSTAMKSADQTVVIKDTSTTKTQKPVTTIVSAHQVQHTLGKNVVNI